MHNEHRVVIYNIRRKKELLHFDVSKDLIINVTWSKKADDLRFATVGLKEIKFWNPADSSKKLFQKGVFGDKGRITNFNCAVFDTEGNCYTAGANGSIYVWDPSNQLQREVKGVHTGEITALAHENGKLISGGRDGKLVINATNQAGELT
jgi:WD40 repeat protein